MAYSQFCPLVCAAALWLLDIGRYIDLLKNNLKSKKMVEPFLAALSFLKSVMSKFIKPVASKLTVSLFQQKIPL